jgi:hypothetical protein
VRTTILLAVGVAVLAGCGGGSSPSTPSTPAPTPTPNPGTVRFLSATLPAGSTVAVSPLNITGQQAQSLSFTAAITVNHDYPDAIVRAYVRTDARICLGGGLAHLSFVTNVEKTVAPASMSYTGTEPACALPYTTTHVEFEVFDVVNQRQVLTQRFPMAYSFVAAP